MEMKRLNRREFIGATVAAGVGGSRFVATAEDGTTAAAEALAVKKPVPPKTLPVPDGARFAGMAGAYSAMYTPFFSLPMNIQD